MEERKRGRGRAGARATTWPRPRVRGLGGEPWLHPGEALHAAAARLKDCAAVDFGPGRLVPWVPVAFGLGVAFYFTAEHEPSAVAAVLAFAAMAAVAFAARRRAMAFPACVFAATVAAGFAVATLKARLIDHPVLAAPAFGASVSGFVEIREERERSDRIVVRVHRMEGARQGLERVRVAVRKGTAPPVGAFVTFKARLSPPLQALRPGGYDFARDLYFQRIGASGFVLGRIATAEPPAPPDLRLRFAAAVDALRDAMDNRIRATLPGDRGAIASALITGKRDAISAPVNDAMYVSSLAHVLSISGYHMAVVAGLVFFVVRALLALIPAASDRFPIKKWSALAALGAASFYLVLSGAEVATQRSFIMVAIVLVGVMADRPALTLRTLALAALLVLVLAPESVVHPSFQMSFAATLVLVAAYQRGTSWIATTDDHSLGSRIALWGVREIVMLIIASLLAGAATALFAAYHFHRLAPYGVLANLLAMPIVSFWVMPMGLLGLAALPFGFDGFFWRLMGEGIGWMISVAQWVASLPGAVGRISAFGIAPVVIGSLGLLLMCLLRTPLRWSGAAVLGVACLFAGRATQPDVLVAGAGNALAIRTGNDALSVVRSGSDTFAVRDWLNADADARPPTDPSLSKGIACDDLGCIGKLQDGRLIALSRSVEALAEDCEQAAVVISAREVQRDCAALVIDRKRLQQSGAVALHRQGDGFVIEPTRPPGYDRPWARAVPSSEATTSSSPPTRRPAPRDATPREEDVDPTE